VCAVPGSMPRTTTIGLILRAGADAFALALAGILWFALRDGCG
jgi:hypothetical protein